MRLNIGCGGATPAGWVNADKASGTGRNYADLEQRLPFDDEAFDYAVAHHVLQMLPYHALEPALGELRRVLKDGGWLRISAPNIVAGIRAQARGDAEWFPQVAGHETTVDGRFCTWATDYGNSRSVFTPRWMADLCTRAGFDFAEPTVPARTWCEDPEIRDLDIRAGESLFVEAQR